MPRLIVALLLIVNSAFSADPTFPPHDLQSDDDLVVELVLSDPTIAQPMEVQFDERNRLWVVEYRQYPEPAGITKIDRDEYWRVRYDRMPPPPPHKFGSPFRGQDRITIHTDTDGDGRYDEHKTFVDGLSLTTSVAFAADGLFVLTPPYLMFYPDADQDDVPDGDPVVHLQGFGIEDTHSIANSLTWGPDGWLYGCNGSTCTMSITSPFWEENTEPVARSGQNIWRYHPPTHRFEVFAEGGGNSFGLEIDAAGNVFSGHNGGNTRGFHFVKGGYYRKNLGKHGDFSNPYTFGHFEGMEHHTVERFSHHFVIYDAVALPERFHNQLIGIDVLHRNLVLSDIQPVGSTFKTKDLARPVWSDGDVFSPVDMCIGHDGCLYVADWADKTVSHLLNREGQMQPKTGRVFRIRSKDQAAYTHPSFADDDLVDRLQSPNRSIRHTALRLIRERHADEWRGAKQLREKIALAKAIQSALLQGSDYSLDLFWALVSMNREDSSFEEEPDGSPSASSVALRKIVEAEPGLQQAAVRLWSDRVGQSIVRGDLRSSILSEVLRHTFKIGEDFQFNFGNLDARGLVEFSAIIRGLPTQEADYFIHELIKLDNMSDDPFFPLMLWWAVEDRHRREPYLLETDSLGGWTLAGEHRQRKLYREFIEPRLVRAIVSDAIRGKHADRAWYSLAYLLQQTPELAQRQTIYTGLEQALVGQAAAQIGEPLMKMLKTRESELSLGLRLRLGMRAAFDEFLDQLPVANASRQKELLAIVSETGPTLLRKHIVEMAIAPTTNASLRSQLIATLATYDSPYIAGRLLGVFGEITAANQAAVIDLLVSRPKWAVKLMDAVEAEQIERKHVTPLHADRMRLHPDAAIVARVEQIWPAITTDKTDIADKLHRWTRRITVGHRGDADRGATLYKQHCATCHKLYGQGQNVGPDLTGYQRSNRQLMLLALIAPSAEIREGYETATLILTDGSVLSGIIGRQNDTSVELKDAKGNVRTIARDTIDTLQITPVSLMPTGLLEKLTDQQTRDLFAYLQTAKQ